jgi:hypothetical protein
MGLFGKTLPDQAYEPNSPADREQFHRMLFVNQMRIVFAGPIIAEFKTPGGATAEVLLEAPEASQPIFLLRRTFDQKGRKQLLVDRDTLAKLQIGPGKYKLIVRLTDKDGRYKSIADYITILDTSIDFGNISGLEKKDRIQRVSELRRNLANLNIDLDYLSGLVADGPITRMEALRSLLTSLGVTPPTEFPTEGLFSDIDGLPPTDRAFVFLASRGFSALKGAPLVSGAGGLFRPDAPVTQAEAAALVARALPLTADSFQPPWLEPVIPQPQPVAQQQSQNIQQPVVQQPVVQQQAPPIRTLSPSNSTLIPIQPTQQSNNGLPLPRTATQQSVRNIPSHPAGTTRYLVVAASFTDPKSADEMIGQLRDEGKTVSLVAENMGLSKIYHVVLGVYNTRYEAEKTLSRYSEETFVPVVIESSAPQAGSIAPPENQPGKIPGKQLRPPVNNAQPGMPWKPKDAVF